MSDAAVMEALDLRAFRTALGGFATGVGVVTARDTGGRPVGMTINSFSSVSLDPPLVLWSIGRTSPSFAVFTTAKHWAVNVLAEDQEALSNTFARPAPDKFEGVDWAPGMAGAPLLAGTVARFECRTEHLYDGGDHIILVGRVEAFDHAGGKPLLFTGGRYGRVAG
ncbi:MAG: flavin reductase family protein [Rhodospirillaceae bacterium]